ncbi:MAG: peptidylprolyl isomerase [Candidatus Aenigmarchaeota archaeon]|nr:peptidylprolyl isomerase [Candidatus Aenigmarchaeota archaeon]
MKNGDFIKIDYVGRLESGEIFDLTSETLAKKEHIFNPNIHYKPVPVVVGAGFVIPGLDKALLDVDVGGKKNVTVSPTEGFGDRDPKLVRVVQKKVFKDQQVEPKPGLVVDFSGIKGRVQSVAAGRVTIDFNNPLAGKKLNYELTVTTCITNPEEQAKAIFEFFGVEKASVTFKDGTAEIEAAALPSDLKERIAKLVLDHVKPDGKGLENVTFIEVFRKK